MSIYNIQNGGWESFGWVWVGYGLESMHVAKEGRNMLLRQTYQCIPWDFSWDKGHNVSLIVECVPWVLTGFPRTPIGITHRIFIRWNMLLGQCSPWGFYGTSHGTTDRRSISLLVVTSLFPPFQDVARTPSLRPLPPPPPSRCYTVPPTVRKSSWIEPSAAIYMVPLVQTPTQPFRFPFSVLERSSECLAFEFRGSGTGVSRTLDKLYFLIDISYTRYMLPGTYYAYKQA